MTRSARVGENAENSPKFEECYDEESHDEAKGLFESGNFEENGDIGETGELSPMFGHCI